MKKVLLTLLAVSVSISANAKSLKKDFDTLGDNRVFAEKVKEKMIEYKKHTDLVRDPKKLKKAEANELPFGAPRYYWQSLKNYDQIKTAKKIKQPLLILQGERDYQVTMVDFNILKTELGSDPKNKFISYSNLNHLFQKGEGRSKPE